MHNFTWYHFFESYQWFVFCYCVTIYSIYAMLAVFSYISITRNIYVNRLRDDLLLIKSYYVPGISIIAGAYNESATIIANVRSLLSMHYAKYEIVIVNDGSKDDTLEKLLREFDMQPIDFAYNKLVPCQPVRGFYKSQNPAYSRLLVVDKVNGGSKADAINAGINAAAYDYFLNTDVDCILDKDTLKYLIQPFLDEKKRVIATGATLRMANSCIVESNEMVKIRAPRAFFPLFQEIEYIRAFVLGKMGWNFVNAVPNVSGGLGMFDKEIVIAAGGYDPASYGEDMDMIVRMCRYMIQTKQKYAVRYVPQSLCWTEGPETLETFKNQRVRWARGLYQIFSNYFGTMFNPKYKRLGLIVFPYNFMFEFLAPIVEALGIICYVYLISQNIIQWQYAIVLLLFVYSYSVFITILSIIWDQFVFRQYHDWRDVIRLCFMALLEPIVYHPMVMIFAITGYVKQFFGMSHAWGNMKRKGFKTEPEVV